jgi:hypothetical protein
VTAASNSISGTLLAPTSAQRLVAGVRETCNARIKQGRQPLGKHSGFIRNMRSAEFVALGYWFGQTKVLRSLTGDSGGICFHARSRSDVAVVVTMLNSLTCFDEQSIS